MKATLHFVLAPLLLAAHLLTAPSVQAAPEVKSLNQAHPVQTTQPLQPAPATRTTCIDDAVISQKQANSKIWIVYPRTPNRTVNAALNTEADRRVQDFQTALVMDAPRKGQSFELLGWYSTTRHSGSVNSFVLHYSAYLGGAHPSHEIVAITFDMTTGRRIRIQDLFLPGSHWLRFLSERVREDLFGRKYLEGGIFEEGISPRSENFINFTLSEDTLTLIFPPYQAGPWTVGELRSEIMLYELREMLRPEFRGQLAGQGD